MTSRKTTRAARRLFRQCLAGGTLDEARATTVARLLAASARRGALPILWQFRRLVRLEVERRTARVESAVPLGDAERARTREGVARLYGAGLHLSFAVDPALIGGMRVRIGSDVFDGSVRARLAALEARF